MKFKSKFLLIEFDWKMAMSINVNIARGCSHIETA